MIAIIAADFCAGAAGSADRFATDSTGDGDGFRLVGCFGMTGRRVASFE
jgi:hypothetical protein